MVSFGRATAEEVDVYCIWDSGETYFGVSITICARESIAITEQHLKELTVRAVYERLTEVLGSTTLESFSVSVGLSLAQSHPYQSDTLNTDWACTWNVSFYQGESVTREAHV